MEVLLLRKSKDQKDLLSLYSFMKCFGSCQFLSGLCVDISGEVPDTYMRIDAKNLVTTTTTIHLAEK